jgi:hypothetical protein
LKITCIPNRLSITQPLNGRPACHYWGSAARLRDHSNFSSPSVLLRRGARDRQAAHHHQRSPGGADWRGRPGDRRRM